MELLNFQQQSIAVLAALYLAAATAVWFAGSRAARYADEISQRTGIGGAVIGMVLLGSITALPEISTSATAAVRGNGGMAVANLLGEAAFQVVVLAVADAFKKREILSSSVENPSSLLQAISGILLLTFAVAGTIVEQSVLGVGAWATGMVLVYGISIFLFASRRSILTGFLLRGSEARMMKSETFPAQRQTDSNPAGPSLARPPLHPHSSLQPDTC